MALPISHPRLFSVMRVEKEKVLAMLLVVKYIMEYMYKVSKMLLDKYRRTVFVVRWLPYVFHPNESDFYQYVEVAIAFP